MLHPENGLFYMAAKKMFRMGSAVWVSAFEIYRGSLYDILNSRHKVVACEQPDGSVKILGLKEKHCETIEDLFSVVSEGLKARSVGIQFAIIEREHRSK
jgi:hypothetical protein